MTVTSYRGFTIVDTNRQGNVDQHALRLTGRPRVVLAAAGFVALVALAAQWNIDGNRRIDYRIYSRAVSSIGDVGLYGYGTGILRFTYPPIAAVLVWPFAQFEEGVGSRIWLTASIMAFVAAHALALAHLGGSRRVTRAEAILGGAVALWLLPAASTLRLGQINAFVMLLLCVDAVAISRHSRWAGIGVGLAAAIKVTPLAVVPVLFAASSPIGRKAALRAVATVTMLTGLAAAVSPDTTSDFVRLISGRATGREGAPSVDLRALLRFVLPSEVVADAVWLAGSAAMVFVALRTARRLGASRSEPDGIGLITVGMCLSTVVSPYTSAHHLTFATAAVALWAARSTNSWHRAVAALGFVSLVAPSSGETAVIRWALVAFCSVTVVGLPTSRQSHEVDDFVAPSAIPQDVGPPRGGH